MQNQPEPAGVVDVCLHGHGIVCGLTAQVGENCDIIIAGGTAIATNGNVISIPPRRFRYYLKRASDTVQKYFPHQVDDMSRINRTVLELSDAGKFDVHNMDPLKPQSPQDLPTEDLLSDKILVILIVQGEQKPYFLLVSPSELLKKNEKLLRDVEALSKEEIVEHAHGIFKRPKETVRYSEEVIDAALKRDLRLKEVVVTRFGYKNLAVISAGQPYGPANLRNPFLQVTTFKDIFYEYKAILDELVPDFVNALEKLHAIYGSDLTHKGASYWDKYRKILIRKWQVFLEQGEHLYYIQYYYDWLIDLVKGYNELRVQISAFSGECECAEKSEQKPNILIKLGPVLGSQSSYTPLPFRDYFIPPLIDGQNSEKWNEIRFLHWRIMMMIWTFDLPFLKLDEKVLRRERFIIPAQEYEDSTNFLEKKNTVDKPGEIPGTVNIEDLSVIFTPGRCPDEELGNQAIPYYYPLDADSPFSLHRYWNYRATQMKQTRHLHSYNAFENEDSYVFISEGYYHRDTLFPLAFHLSKYPFLRIEGHIGKIFDSALTIKDMADSMQRYNLVFNIIAISVDELNDFVNKKPVGATRPTGLGIEHSGGLEQGQTLVLVYIKTDEQIELNECKKDALPEIVAGAIVADFTIPLILRK